MVGWCGEVKMCWRVYACVYVCWGLGGGVGGGGGGGRGGGTRGGACRKEMNNPTSL